MSLSTSELLHIAKLAALSLTTDEQKAFLEDVAILTDFAHQLQQLETSEIKPLLHPLELCQPLRADEVKHRNLCQELMHSATNTTGDGYYRVPRVLMVED